MKKLGETSKLIMHILLPTIGCRIGLKNLTKNPELVNITLELRVVVDSVNVEATISFGILFCIFISLNGNA
jgi:hypothetical protein